MVRVGGGGGGATRGVILSGMAREESSREDLLAEAVALVPRAEFVVPDEAEPVTVGFRRDGAASVFFGEDPAFHFNAAGELRRAYVGGRLIKAERGRLVALTRLRTATEVQLVRHEMNPTETEALAWLWRERAGRFLRALDAGAAVLRREVRGPTGAGGVEPVRGFLAERAAGWSVAAGPGVGGGGVGPRRGSD